MEACLCFSGLQGVDPKVNCLNDFSETKEGRDGKLRTRSRLHFFLSVCKNLERKIMTIFLSLSRTIYVLDAQKNHLSEMVLFSIHNVCAC